MPNDFCEKVDLREKRETIAINLRNELRKRKRNGWEKMYIQLILKTVKLIIMFKQ